MNTKCNANTEKNIVDSQMMFFVFKFFVQYFIMPFLSCICFKKKGMSTKKCVKKLKKSIKTVLEIRLCLSYL